MINMVVRLVMSKGCEKLHILDSDFFFESVFSSFEGVTLAYLS